MDPISPSTRVGPRSRVVEISFVTGALILFCVYVLIYPKDLDRVIFLAAYSLTPNVTAAICLFFLSRVREEVCWAVGIFVAMLVVLVCEGVYNTFGEWFTPGDYLGFLMFGFPGILLALGVRAVLLLFAIRDKLGNKL